MDVKSYLSAANIFDLGCDGSGHNLLPCIVCLWLCQLWRRHLCCLALLQGSFIILFLWFCCLDRVYYVPACIVTIKILLSRYLSLWNGHLERLRIPFHYSLQREIAQTVSEALLSQLHVPTTWDTWEHHHQGWALLTPSPRVRPMSWRPGHGGWRWMGTSNQGKTKNRCEPGKDKITQIYHCLTWRSFGKHFQEI